MTSNTLPRLSLPLLEKLEIPPALPPQNSNVKPQMLPLEQFFQRIGYVTLKLTNGCNLQCSYCNVEAVTPKTPMMPLERFKQVARLLLANAQESQVGLEFHGGEPLLLPDEWFAEAVAYAKGLAQEHGKKVVFPLVTNGTLLTRERLLRLTGLGIRFCLSVDGPPEINDAARGSGRAVERAIKLFRELRIGHGVLTVMSRANCTRMTEVLDWFSVVGIEDFRINFLQPQGRGTADDQLLTGEEMFEGMRQVLNHMSTTGLSVHEAEMGMTVTRFLNGRNPRPGLSCWELECQAGRRYVAVDLGGVIHACGTDLSNHKIGHLDRDMDTTHYDQVLKALHTKDAWYIRCFDCSAKPICRFSCPTSDRNSTDYRERECLYTRLMHRYLATYPYVAEHVGALIDSRRGNSGRANPMARSVPLAI